MPPKILLLLVLIACGDCSGHRWRTLVGIWRTSRLITWRSPRPSRSPSWTTVPPPFPGLPSIGPLPVHCRVDGVINRRKGVGGEELRIGFAVSLPAKEACNGDFMMQGGGGGNRVVAYPLRRIACGQQTGSDARVRGPARIRDTERTSVDSTSRSSRWAAFLDLIALAYLTRRSVKRPGTRTTMQTGSVLLFRRLFQVSAKA